MVKVVGHQWYWEYQYDNALISKRFDSYITTVGWEERDGNNFRLLDVDNRLSLPTGVNSILLVGSADVLHS